MSNNRKKQQPNNKPPSTIVSDTSSTTVSDTSASEVKLSVESEPTPAPVQVEEYKPSENKDKYPEPKAPDTRYKILAFRNDYVKLQEEVTKHLNSGWELVGGVSVTMNVSPFESVTVFAQAVVIYG